MSSKTYLDPTAYQRDIWTLARMVYESGWKPDLILGLWRGGATPAIAVHEYLEWRGWKVRHLPLKCSSYAGMENRTDNVVFECAAETLATVRPGERVLAVDDVFDTGKTAEAVRAEIARRGAECRVACVHWKPGRNLTPGRPDWHVREDGDGWIVFPHELCGLSPEEARAKGTL